MLHAVAAPAFWTSRGTAGARWSRDGAHYNLLHILSDVLLRICANTVRAGFRHVQHVYVNRDPTNMGPPPKSKKVEEKKMKRKQEYNKK